MGYLLDEDRRFAAGAQWLDESILADHWVLTVAGTHGKTMSAAMLAWILEAAGYQPGFVIGDVPNNCDSSARLGGGRFLSLKPMNTTPPTLITGLSVCITARA